MAFVAWAALADAFALHLTECYEILGLLWRDAVAGTK